MAGAAVFCCAGVPNSHKLFNFSGLEVWKSLEEVKKPSINIEPKAKAEFYIIEVIDVQGQIYRKRVVVL